MYVCAPSTTHMHRHTHINTHAHTHTYTHAYVHTKLTGVHACMHTPCTLLLKRQ